MKRTPLRRVSKSPRTKLIKENDDLFRAIIRLRDKVCQKTGRTEKLQVAHFWSRKDYIRIRWDLQNACLLTSWNHIHWAHQKHQEFMEWWKKRIGQDQYEALELKARYVAPVSMDFLILKNQELKTLLSTLQKEDSCV